MLLEGYVGCLDRTAVQSARWEQVKHCIRNVEEYKTDSCALLATGRFVERRKDGPFLRVSILDDSDMTLTVKLSEQTVEIRRDTRGVHTVYYCRDTYGTFWFSSDIRFLLVLAGSRTYDRTALQQMAVLGYVYDDSLTLYEGVLQVPRGTACILSRDSCRLEHGECRAASAASDSFESFREAFRSALSASVEKSLDLAVRKAFFLSGGMDSAAIAIAASRRQTIHTVTFVSECNGEDAFYAGKLPEIIRSRHHVIPFRAQEAVQTLPYYLHSLESVELDGIFSPLGGYAYFLLCGASAKLGFEAVVPGEGADELLGGYYWQLTHTLGFADKLRTLVEGTEMKTVVAEYFPLPEDRIRYRRSAYRFLQGSALTNYHLSCISHTARILGLISCPVFMSGAVWKSLENVPMEYLCDGMQTKLILRDILLEYLRPYQLEGLVTRKKLAMPSVMPLSLMETFRKAAENAYQGQNHPFRDCLNGNPLSLMMLDVLHKYYTLAPLDTPNQEAWDEDWFRLVNHHERIVHW